MSRLAAICLVFLLALTACDSALDKAVSTPEIVSAMQLEMRSGSPAPLAGHISVETSVPTRVLVEMSDGNGHDLSIAFSELSTCHENPILGMRPGRIFLPSWRVPTQCLQFFFGNAPRHAALRFVRADSAFSFSRAISSLPSTCRLRPNTARPR